MKAICALFVSLLVATQAWCQEAPDALVRRVTENVLEVLRKDRDIHAGNIAKASALVETQVAPHLDFTHLTALALPKHWDEATPEQREQLIQGFRTMLIRTCSNLLITYDNEKIRYSPPEPGLGNAQVRVRSEILDPGSETVTFDVDLEQRDGRWLAYNLEVGGISLVTTYREQFAQVIRNTGLPGLIEAIAKKNRAYDLK